MTREAGKIWLPTILVIAVLILGWVVYQQLASRTNLEAYASFTAEVRSDLPELTPQPVFTVAALEDYRVILERPLFSANRLPPVAEGAGSLGVPQDFNYVLKGILIEDTARIALLRNNSDGEIVRIAEGNEINEWLIKAVEPDFIVVERDGNERILELEHDPQPSPSDRSTKDAGK